MFRATCLGRTASSVSPSSIDGIEVRKLNPPHWKGNLPKTYFIRRKPDLPDA